MKTKQHESQVDEGELQRLLAQVQEADEPLPFATFSNEEQQAIRVLIAQGSVGVTVDWKVWPSGRPLPAHK